MRIDLHCHTKKVKTGDAYTRNVTKDKFFQKVIEAEVKIIAITNHNQFDYMQYKEFKDVTEGYCDIWPGVELDIIGKADQKGNCKRGHLIVIANPKNVELFNTQVQELVNDEDVNTFQIGVEGDLPVILFLLQYVVQSVIQVFRQHRARPFRARGAQVGTVGRHRTWSVPL